MCLLLYVYGLNTPTAEYRCGDGIMAHKDGPFYHSRAAIISLGGPAIFHFKRPRSSRAEPQEEKGERGVRERVVVVGWSCNGHGATSLIIAC